MKMRKRERVSALGVGARARARGRGVPVPRGGGPAATRCLGAPRAWGSAVPGASLLFHPPLRPQVWFKNRRAKWRRQKRSSSEESENAEKWSKPSSKASPEKRDDEGKSDLDSDS